MKKEVQSPRAMRQKWKKCPIAPGDEVKMKKEVQSLRAMRQKWKKCPIAPGVEAKMEKMSNRLGR
jgi:hypothetical protein